MLSVVIGPEERVQLLPIMSVIWQIKKRIRMGFAVVGGVGASRLEAADSGSLQIIWSKFFSRYCHLNHQTSSQTNIL